MDSAALNDSQQSSYRFCRDLTRREGSNFYYSFLLVAPPLRRSMCALYAFMRHTDDLADEPAPIAEKRGALDRWREGLSRALESGRTQDWQGLPALVDTVERHAIPRKYLEDVIDGVAMDLDLHPFETFEELYGYCYRVASAVGLCCVRIWGYRSEGGRAEELAEACGIALQLTNILRDVREDAERGRVYLPREDLARFGVTDDELRSRTPSSRARELFEFEARRAYAFYEKAAPLDDLVEPAGRPVLRTIVGIYRALLDEIVRRDYDVLSCRVAIPRWRKAAIAARSLTGRFSRPVRGPAKAESSRC
jgi:phytoene synthase